MDILGTGRVNILYFDTQKGRKQPYQTDIPKINVIAWSLKAFSIE